MGWKRNSIVVVQLINIKHIDVIYLSMDSIFGFECLFIFANKNDNYIKNTRGDTIKTFQKREHGIFQLVNELFVVVD